MPNDEWEVVDKPEADENEKLVDDWDVVEEHPRPEEKAPVETAPEMPDFEFENEQEQEEPNLDADGEKLIGIIDQDKEVNGLNWKQFTQTMADKGYPDPEHDNHLRIVFNLAGDDHPEIAYHAEQMLGYEGAFDQNFREQSEQRVLQLVEDEVLNPARRGEEFPFHESQRETILYCQKELNESGNGQYEYSFNENVPVQEGYMERGEEPQEAEAEIVDRKSVV